jgi:carbonic anhydrase
MEIQEVIAALRAGNAEYVNSASNPGDVSPSRRLDLAENGQHPIAVVLTCADSRVVPEHIFSVGLGTLFVVRTAGNVVGDYERGSIEYGAGHLGARVVLVLGHTHCGAVGAALEAVGETSEEHAGGESGLASLIGEIARAIDGIHNAREAVRANVENSARRLLESAELRELVGAGEVAVVKAVYDIETGVVEIFG